MRCVVKMLDCLSVEFVRKGGIVKVFNGMEKEECKKELFLRENNVEMMHLGTE